jgi:integrase/recombinase XerC
MDINKFLDYLIYERRYSVHTIEAYKTDLGQFSDFLIKEFNTGAVEATSLQIRSWLSGLMTGKLSIKSLNRKISSLRAFYTFLEKENKLPANPMSKVSVPKLPKRLPVFLSEQNTSRLLDDFEFSGDFKGIRDRLILETFYCTGIRLSELVGLRHMDFGLGGNQIRVTGKGNKERIIPVVDSLRVVYLQYVEEKRKLYPCSPNEFIFVTDKGKKVYPKFVYRVVNFYLSSTTTVGKRSPHVLRHSFATHMLNNGADINAIKDLLGHSSLSATEVYTHNTVEKIKSVYKQAHPKA